MHRVVVQVQPRALQPREETRDVAEEALADVVESRICDLGAVVRAESAAEGLVVEGAVGVVEDDESLRVWDLCGLGVDFFADAEELQGEDGGLVVVVVGGVVGAFDAVADGVVEGAACVWQFEGGGSFGEGWVFLGASWAGEG
jgi:hypothetical protein